MRKSGLALGATTAAGIGLALYSAWHGRKVERQVPVDGSFLDIDGARLHYVVLGPPDAKPIVMIHGLGGQLRNFTYSLTEILAKKFRLIVIDRPRSGYSTAAPGSEPGIVDQAAIIARFIIALRLDRPLLVGHSLGGAVSLALAEDHPGLVGGLALLAPLTQPNVGAGAMIRAQLLRPRATRALLANLIGIPLVRLMRTRPDSVAFWPERRPADFPERGGGLLTMRPAALAAMGWEVLRLDAETAAIAARYADLDLPVSILFGREDQVLDYRRNGVMTTHAIPGARLELIDGGHMIPVTQPELTAAFIEKAMRA